MEIRDFGVLLPLLISEHPLARWGCVASLRSSPTTRNTYIDNTYRPRLLRLKSYLDRFSTKHSRKGKIRGIHTSSSTLSSFRGKQLSPQQMWPRLMYSFHKIPGQHRSPTPPLLQACLLTRVLTLLKRKQNGDQAWKSPKQTKLFKPRQQKLNLAYVVNWSLRFLVDASDNHRRNCSHLPNMVWDHCF